MITTETLAIQKAIRIAIMIEMPNIIVKSDCTISIKSILGQTKVPKQINTLIADIRSFASMLGILDSPTILGQQSL